ncbi:DUF3889 domain-containing protein [bacterium LRH843]|nr:DUF3889 domain-containing protein [bacterium LRH843]
MMKKILACFVCSTLLMSTNIVTVPIGFAETVDRSESEMPSKWGKIAVEKAEEKYPGSKIIDYRHAGTEEKPKSIIETFKLIVKGTDKEFGVLVAIEIEKGTEQILNVTFKEVAE